MITIILILTLISLLYYKKYKLIEKYKNIIFSSKKVSPIFKDICINEKKKIDINSLTFYK
jgi:hypothetical protein